jgi:hypothetical protein
MKAWSSPVYAHFITPPEIVNKSVNGKQVPMYKFVCKRYVCSERSGTLPRLTGYRNPSASVSKQTNDASTANLMKHVRVCSPEVSTEDNGIESYAHGRSYTPEVLRLLLVKWVTLCSRPYSIVQDEPFIQIIKMLYNKATIVTPKMVSSDVQKVFHLARESVIKNLKV